LWDKVTNSAEAVWDSASSTASDVGDAASKWWTQNAPTEMGGKSKGLFEDEPTKMAPIAPIPTVAAGGRSPDDCRPEWTPERQAQDDADRKQYEASEKKLADEAYQRREAKRMAQGQKEEMDDIRRRLRPVY
jgi:hypothetical protein